jgi:signal transduction histidine kinase
MEGSIHVISQVGKGSTFAVTLKRVKERANKC